MQFGSLALVLTRSMQTANAAQSATLPNQQTNNADTAAAVKSAVLALKPVVSSAGFVFPPIYSFPAFFTRQPASSTYASQVRQWHALMLDYCRHHRIFRLDLSDAALLQSTSSSTSELWGNTQIKRRARPDFILELVHLLVKSGSALYDPPLPSKLMATSVTPQLSSGTGVYVLWRSLDEWSQAIYNWVVGSGQTNSIMTFYELTDSSSTKDFADLPTGLLKLALQPLIKQNKAQIFQAGDGEGVKFV